MSAFIDERDAIEFTGRNSVDVRAWIKAHGAVGETEAWFVTKGMTASTGGQAWRYVRANRASVIRWPESVVAAVYDPRVDAWHPVRPGDVIERQGTGYGVRATR